MTFNTFDRKHAEGFFTVEDIASLYALQEGRCYFCDVQLGALSERAAFHIDHLTPISRGGTNWPGNLALACENCNKRKYNKDTVSLWKKLRTERGEDWYKHKVAANRLHTPRKSQLTKQRKTERQASLADMSQEIEAALATRLQEGCYMKPEDSRVMVNQNGQYISIWFCNSRIEFPAPTQIALASWTAKNYIELANSLITIEHLSGYLRPQRREPI